MANGRAGTCAENPISESAISSASNEISLHLDRFLSFNQRKSRFSWNGSVDELEQFIDARFVKGNEDDDCSSGRLKKSCNGSWPETRTNNADTIEGCVRGELNAKLLEKIESLQINVISLQNQINSFTRDPSPDNSRIGDYEKKLCDLSRELDLAKIKNGQYADEMRISNEEKQCLLTSLRFSSKESKESTNNSQHELPNADLIAENKSLQETRNILNNDNQVLSAKGPFINYGLGGGGGWRKIKGGFEKKLRREGGAPKSVSSDEGAP